MIFFNAIMTKMLKQVFNRTIYVISDDESLLNLLQLS